MGLGSIVKKATGAVKDAFSSVSGFMNENPWIGDVGGAALGYLGSQQASSATQQANEQNIAYQKEFAQNGIRWKVADAKAAGLHPLIGAGAQTVSFSPSVVGDTSKGEGLAQMGQNISRAVDAQATRRERAQQLAMQEQQNFMQYAMWQAQLNKELAEVDYIKAQTSRITGSSAFGQPRNPPFPDGSSPEKAVLGFQFIKGPDGKIRMYPSQAQTQAWENSEFLGSNFNALGWWLKHIYGGSGDFVGSLIPDWETLRVLPERMFGKPVYERR